MRFAACDEFNDLEGLSYMLEIRKLYSNEFNVDPDDINILQYTDLFESNQIHKNENID